MNKELLESLIAVQSELKAPKSQYNSFGKYKYRSCEDILEAVKPLLAANGLALSLSDEPCVASGRYYIKATATVYGAGDAHSVTGYAREPDEKKGMDDSQITGTASSYARKYALNGLFLIDDTKDADTDEYHAQQAKKTAKKAETSGQNATKTQAKQEPAKPAIVCQACGKPLVGVTHNGKAFTPEQIAESTNKKFKRTLCWDCANRMKENG